MSKIEAALCSSPAIVILLHTMPSLPRAGAGWFLDLPNGLLLLARSNYCALLWASQLNFTLRRKNFIADGLSEYVQDCLFEMRRGVTDSELQIALSESELTRSPMVARRRESSDLALKGNGACAAPHPLWTSGVLF
jgi:hypothetical protein